MMEDTGKENIGRNEIIIVQQNNSTLVIKNCHELDNVE